MKTRRSFLPLAAVFFLLAFFYFTSYPNKKSNELATATQAAFLKFDANITRCTPAAFLLSDVDTTRQIAPLFENLGNYHFAVSNLNDDAQAFFDQGLRLSFAFNYPEAHRSFLEAARLSSGAAMVYWGQAYALGPNINDPFPSNERMKQAYTAVQKALQHADMANQKEKDLIEALSKRYSKDTLKSTEDLSQAYRFAMEKVLAAYPEDPDVLTLYADAVMNTMPWNYWDKEGNPNPKIPEAGAALEKAFLLNRDHPGAHYLYIHMMELPNPDQAVPCAEKLGKLMPGAGHLVHMPSHIFIRVGRYKEAAQANVDAVAADQDYISQCYAQGMYPLVYYPHNIHFLWSAATLMGDSETAINAATKTAQKVPLGELTNLPFLQDYASSPMLAYVRFGKWDEMLTTPFPGKDIKHMNLIWHYGRGIAFLRKDNLKEAEEELQAISEMLKDPELKEFMANFNNPTSELAKVAYEVLAGEIAAKKGDYDEAIIHLKKGVAFQDALAYSEPSPWHIPVRQSLGALLLKANKPQEAEKVYREDLAINRGNGWSLKGLHKSLLAQGKQREAKLANQEFETAWKDSDIQITSSVF